MDLRVWQTLAEPKHEELIGLASATDAADVAAVSRLRKACPDAELVRAALMLAEARRKAVPKFGAARAATLWADPQGVEMASSWVVADYKVTMYNVMLPGWPMADLCCGIGGDAMAFVKSMDVLAIDNDPSRAWMAGRNAGCKTLVGDAVTVELPDGPLHIDPARRDGALRRMLELDDIRPGWSEVRALVRRNRWGAMVKLGPGTDLERVQSEFPEGQIEVISERGTLVQCVVRAGQMRYGDGPRLATLLTRRVEEEWDSGSEHSIAGETGGTPPVHADETAPARFVYEPDDSVERAGLLHVLCEKVGAPMLHPRVGLLTSETLMDTPWLTAFEVLGHMPWHERRVKDALDALGAGIVEVKTRGKAVAPDVVQMALRGSGDRTLTVFILRFDKAVRAIITRRV